MDENIGQKQWDEEIACISRRAAAYQNSNSLVTFYGSSSIRLWDSMTTDLAPLHTLNMGFGGSTYSDCLYYFDTAFEGVQPKQIVLYGGDNDMANGETPQDIQKSFDALLKKIGLKYPETNLAVISIKPSPARLHLLPDIIQANGLLQQSIKNVAGSYIDVFTPMLNREQKPRKELFLEDDLHMNAQGYDIWADKVRDYFLPSPKSPFTNSL